MGKISRREARELAFVVLFEQAVTGDDIEMILENAKESRDMELNIFSGKLVNGVMENIETIDGLIKSNLKGWSFSRISKVALALLRLAVYELKYEEDIPVGVSINEAVELAKKYGGDRDASYLNGVLSAVAKSGEICKKNHE